MAEKKIIELEVKDNVKSLKAQFADAKKELQQMAAAYGENSQQAINAAKRAAELKDIIDDTGEAIKNLQGGGTFQALGTALGSVASGFGAVQGAVNLLGVDSAQVEEALLRVQSAMAMAEGLRGLEDAGRAFGALKSGAVNAFQGMTNAGKAFAVTGIGLIITGIATAIAYAADLEKMFFGATEGQKELTESVKDYNKGAQEAITKVNEVGASFKLAQKGVISKEEALKQYNDTLGDSLGKATSYNEAEKLFREKTDAYIKATALRAQANALLQKAAEEQANSLTASMEDQTSPFDKALNFAMKAYNQQDLADKHFRSSQKQGVVEAQQNAKKREKIFKDEAQRLLEQAETIDKTSKIETDSDNKKTTATKNNADERKNTLNSLREFEQGILDGRLSDEDRELIQLQRKYDEQIKLAEKYKHDITLLEESLQVEINAIRSKYETKDFEATKKALDDKAVERAKANDQEKYDAVAQGIALRGTQAQMQLEEQNATREHIEELKQLRQGYTQVTLQGLELVSELASLFSKKDEASARKAFQIQKAVSIAETTIKTIQAVQNTFATASASPITTVFPAYPFIQAGVAGAFGAVQIAKIAQTQYQGGGGTSSSTVASSAGSGSVTSGNITPNFNISGNSTNPLNNLVVQSYVVSGQVTSAQELERKRINTSTF